MTNDNLIGIVKVCLNWKDKWIGDIYHLIQLELHQPSYDYDKLVEIYENDKLELNKLKAKIIKFTGDRFNKLKKIELRIEQLDKTTAKSSTGMLVYIDTIYDDGKWLK